MPFTKILVAVDFSPHSEAAIRVAADLSKRYHAPLHLVHVVEALNYAVLEGLTYYTPESLQKMLAGFDELLLRAERAAQAAGALDARGHMLRGTPFAEIARFAREGGYDLIVMGTHGQTGLKEALIGSVAERVVRIAPCPVMTVRLPDPS